METAKEKDKDKDEGVLGCWIEEIEERRLVTEGPTWSPTPPTFLDISALPTRTTTVPNATGKSIKRNTTKFIYHYFAEMILVPPFLVKCLVSFCLFVHVVPF